MKHATPIALLICAYLMTGCSNGLEEKGFQVGPTSQSDDEGETDGISKDSLKFHTRPSSVLLTGVAHVRLATIYKVNINKKSNTTFIGSNSFHYSYEDMGRSVGNNWHGNLIPGFEAVYGYNMVNISHYDIKANKQRTFFEKPVLIKTLYYPAFTTDTLNNRPVNRDYFIASVYNDDTNKDGFINLQDLRRIYLFNLSGEKQKPLVPENYSVYRSQYDPDNDFIYLFAQLDANNNGKQDEGEPIHIFWIDLKDPGTTGRQY